MFFKWLHKVEFQTHKFFHRDFKERVVQKDSRMFFSQKHSVSRKSPYSRCPHSIDSFAQWRKHSFFIVRPPADSLRLTLSTSGTVCTYNSHSKAWEPLQSLFSHFSLHKSERTAAAFLASPVLTLNSNSTSFYTIGEDKVAVFHWWLNEAENDIVTSSSTCSKCN